MLCKAGGILRVVKEYVFDLFLREPFSDKGIHICFLNWIEYMV